MTTAIKYQVFVLRSTIFHGTSSVKNAPTNSVSNSREREKRSAWCCSPQVHINHQLPSDIMRFGASLFQSGKGWLLCLSTCQSAPSFLPPHLLAAVGKVERCLCVRLPLFLSTPESIACSSGGPFRPTKTSSSSPFWHTPYSAPSVPSAPSTFGAESTAPPLNAGGPRRSVFLLLLMFFFFFFFLLVLARRPGQRCFRFCFCFWR